jgi:hypothetical protein
VRKEQRKGAGATQGAARKPACTVRCTSGLPGKKAAPATATVRRREAFSWRTRTPDWSATGVAAKMRCSPALAGHLEASLPLMSRICQF